MPTLNLNELSHAKAQSSAASVEDWENIIMRSYKVFVDQGIKDEQFQSLVECCRDPNQLALFAREFFRFFKQDPRQRSAFQVLLNEVDESEFSMQQWTDAIMKMYDWLEREQKEALFTDVLGYINCCSQSANQQLSGKKLSDLVVEFLEEFGFERSEK